jgi:hypothetical protein
MSFFRTIGIWWVVAHALTCMAALAILQILPPVRGRMMMVPLIAVDNGALIRFVIDHDARLVARGSLPGSMIVYGDRAALGAALFTHGWVPLAAWRDGCGATTENEG